MAYFRQDIFETGPGRLVSYRKSSGRQHPVTYVAILLLIHTTP